MEETKFYRDLDTRFRSFNWIENVRKIDRLEFLTNILKCKERYCRYATHKERMFYKIIRSFFAVGFSSQFKIDLFFSGKKRDLL